MRFGFVLSSGMSEVGSLRPSFDAVVRQTQIARDGGFDGVFAGHWYARHPLPLLQPLPLLGRLAAESGDMQVGTSVLTAPLLHPIDVAEQAVTLDVISNGRFVLGVGTAYGPELEFFEIERTTRGRRTEEMLEVMRSMWRGEPFTHAGRFFDIGEITPTMLPIQPGGPEIWVAGGEEPGVRRAGRVGDAWLPPPSKPFAKYEHLDRVYRETFAEAQPGREPACRPLIVEVFVAEDRRTAFETGRPFFDSWYPQLNRHLNDPDLDHPYEELAGEIFLVGDPEGCAAELERYVDLGFDYLLFLLPWYGVSAVDNERALSLLGGEVLPRVAAYARARG